MIPSGETRKVAMRGRMDFQTEVVELGEGPGRFTLRMIPDPRRYDMIESNGSTRYVDKYLGHTFSLEDMLNASGIPGLPIYALDHHIESTSDYMKERLGALDNEMTSGEYTPPSDTPMAHRDLDNSDEHRLIGFISIDICGATAMRRNDAASFDRKYALFMRELGTVVGQFNGSILKTKGDGFIAYIDHPSYNSMCDALVDMGLSILAVTHHSLNAAFDKSGLGSFNIRIGADIGEASIAEFVVPSTGFSSRDVVSDALNRAVKIEEACRPNEFWIGRSLYELIHVQWLERAGEVEFDGKQVGISGYKVYRVS